MMFSDRDWEVKSIVTAPADDVFRAVVASRQNEMRMLGSGYQNAVQVDERDRTITVRGHWWYQGTHRIGPHPDGCEVMYQVRNMGGFAAFLDKPNYRRTMRRDLDRLLSEICRQLGCRFTDS